MSIKSNRQTLLKRTPDLIVGEFKRLTIPKILSTSANSVISLFNSIIAARYIGTGAMAAIAVISPIVVFYNMLNSLLVSGITLMIVRRKSKGNNEDASKVFGSILIITFFIFAAASFLLYINLERILSFFTSDLKLLRDSISYALPLIFINTFSETLLCFERGFKADGQEKYFSVRGVISSVLSIVFSLAAVRIFPGSLFALSAASCFASVSGYLWSFMYIFSKNCTIRPSFSSLFNPREFFSYISEELQVGFSYSVSDGLDLITSSGINKILCTFGGSLALGCYSIFTSIAGIFTSISLSNQQSSLVLGGLFYTERDAEGVKIVFNTAFDAQKIECAMFAILCLFLPKQLGSLFNAEASSYPVLIPCIQFCSILFSAKMINHLCCTFCIATNKPNLSFLCYLIEDIAIITALYLGGSIGGTTGMWISLAFIPSVILMITNYLIINSKDFFGKPDAYDEISFSTKITSEKISETSSLVQDYYSSNPLYSPLAYNASLLIEETLHQILLVNQDNPRLDTLSSDIRIRLFENTAIFTIIDTGCIFDPVHVICSSEDQELMNISQYIVKDLSPEATYSRTLDLNISHFSF